MKRTNSELMINSFKNKTFKVVRLSNKEFELENGDVYPLDFELEEELTIEEFQKILDDSKKIVVCMLEKINDE